MPRPSFSRTAQRYSLFIGLFFVVTILGLVFYLYSRKPVRIGPNDYGTPVAHAYSLMYSGGGVVGSVKDSAGTTFNTFEFAPSDRLHITTTVGGVKYESIRSEGTLYLLGDNGKWRRSAIPAALPQEGTSVPVLPILSLDQLSALSAKERNQSVFSALPKSQCPADNRNCSMYRETLVDQQAQIYYIDVPSGRLFRIDQMLGNLLTMTTRFEYRSVTVSIPTDEQTDTSPVSLSPQPSIPPDVLQKLQQSSPAQ